MIFFSNPRSDLDGTATAAPWRLRVGAAAAALALLTAACGSDAAESAAAEEPVAEAPADEATGDAMADEAMEGEAMEAMDDDAMEDGAMEDDAMEAMDDVSHSDVSTASSEFGDILVDGAGLTLYGFTQDTEGQSVCNGDCATAWPPLWVDGADVPAGFDTAVFSVITRDDGSYQLAAGGWPLYTFANDAAPGDVNGQGVNDVWFVVSADGALVMEAVEAESAASSGY